jgi:hypothetical protein
MADGVTTQGKVLSEKDGRFELFIPFEGKQVFCRPRTAAESRALKAALESAEKTLALTLTDDGGWKPVVVEP